MSGGGSSSTERGKRICRPGIKVQSVGEPCRAIGNKVGADFPCLGKAREGSLKGGGRRLKCESWVKDVRRKGIPMTVSENSEQTGTKGGLKKGASEGRRRFCRIKGRFSASRQEPDLDEKKRVLIG